ncbi:MAG TPA: DNA polymerase I [Myxococcaceae bacterium]
MAQPPKTQSILALSFKPPTPVEVAPGERPVLTLIDASNFIFRAYHALPHLSTSRGVATNAVYGFTRMVLMTLRELSPTHIALAFDKESRASRQAIDPTYKANREGPPPDLVPQFALIRKVVEALDVPVLELSGWEADDVIGTLALRAKAEGFKVLVVTGDKDFIQIVDDDVELYDPMHEKHTRPADVKERLSIVPGQMRDYQSLIGDAIDNIPGVPGIGPKTASDLINQFGDLDALFARIGEVKKPKTREALIAHKPQVLRARQLVTFKTDLPLEVKIADLERRPIRDAEARDLFSELEFFKLLQEMPAPAPTPLPEKTAVVLDAAGLDELAALAREGGELSLYPAYEGLPYAASLIGLGVAAKSGRTFYLPLQHSAILAGPQLPLGLFKDKMGPILRSKEIRKLGHGLKSLSLLLSSLGLELEGAEQDVELVSYLLNPSRKEHALQDLARERLRLELPALPSSAQGKRGAPLPDLSVEEVAPIYGSWAEASRRLAAELWPELDRVGLGKLARELEVPLLPVLARMERRGVRLDRAALRRINETVEAQCRVQLAKIFELAGHEFMVGSNQQLAVVLYDELKLPVLKRGKTGPSTDHEVLEKLAQQHPLPRAVIEYRMLSKLKSTYLDTLPELVAHDGRLHTTFHQAAAATGRLSSTDPNLQNIPIRTDLGKEIRRAFVADDGAVLISADYSQIELRILAHVAQDPALVEAFSKDEDVHTRTASEVFGVPPGEVTDNMRRAAKMVNYGISYGLSPHGLATRLDIPTEEARSIIERYFARYAGIKRYLDETVTFAHQKGYVETLFGRRRYMPDIASRNRNVAQAAERAAINMPIQGTAADLIKMAMLKVDVELASRFPKAAMLLQVHDELLLEAPEGEAAGVSALVQGLMSQVVGLRVPLVVEVGHGRSWADAH